MQESKLLSKEAFLIAEKRRKVKGKGERKRYTQLNAEFKRLERRDNKSFLSAQCKEREENNSMGKTRDLFKKTRDIKGTLHPKMGTIKDRNGKNRTEVEDIKQRWQKYTENYTKKVLKTGMTMMVWSLTQSQTSWSVRPSGP